MTHVGRLAVSTCGHRARFSGRKHAALRLAALVPAVLTALALAGGRPAYAHSFLASTHPVQGARLQDAPQELALQFSEAVAADSLAVTLRHAGGEQVPTPPPGLESDAAVVQQPLPVLDAGVYVTSWHVTSAVDAHESAGEFAFAVGAPGADLPATVAPAANVDAPSAAVTWLFFAGLSLAAGGLAGPALLLVGSAGPARRWRRSWLRAGVSLALAGVGARMALEGVLGAALTLAATALLATAVLLLLALLAARLATPWPATGLLSGALVVWSSRSHSAATDGTFGWLLDGTHLAAGAIWAGALAFVVAELWRGRGGDRRALLDGVRRYARTATLLVVLVAGSGVVQAARLLPDLAALWNTGYGIVIVVKTALVFAALVLAAVARGRALPRARPRLLRGLTTGESSVLAVVLAAAAVLVNAAPPQPANLEASLLGPPPIEGPVVHDMGLAGALTVEVKAGGERLDVAVLGPSGGIDGAQVEVAARYPDGTSAELHPRPCGAGCYTQELSLPAGDTELAVTAHAQGWTGGTMTARMHWPPPPDQPQRFERMRTAMQAVSHLRVTESVYSGPAGANPAPPRGPGVAMSGERFVSIMPWAGGGVTDVRAVVGDPAAFSFYLPGSTMYFTVRVDEQGRLVEQQLVNRGHEIDYRFTYPAG